VFGPEAHIATMPKRDQSKKALRQVEQITEVVRFISNPLVVGSSTPREIAASN
jgi:hypothetical protein